MISVEAYEEFSDNTRSRSGKILTGKSLEIMLEALENFLEYRYVFFMYMLMDAF